MISTFLIAMSLVSAIPQKAFDCGASGPVKDVVAKLGELGVPTPDQWEVLATEPAAAACELVRCLHTVHETHVAGYEQGKHPGTMRVIWAIRLLRYLTDCQDFRAPTAENPATWDNVRRDFLLGDSSDAPVHDSKRAHGMRFFQTWMSRDSVFIAPVDAQRSIIEQWQRWYQTLGSHGFQFQTCESIDNWYF